VLAQKSENPVNSQSFQMPIIGIEMKNPQVAAWGKNPKGKKQQSYWR
jgi:hypothetical protein